MCTLRDDVTGHVSQFVHIFVLRSVRDDGLIRVEFSCVADQSFATKVQFPGQRIRPTNYI